VNLSPLPWEEWLSTDDYGDVHKVTRELIGQDLSSFRASLSVKARGKGLGVKTEIDGEVMYFMTFPLDRFRGGLEMLHREKAMRAFRENVEA
jgi:hypothetical protein